MLQAIMISFQSDNDKNSDEEEQEGKEATNIFGSSSEVKEGVFSALVKTEIAVDFQVYQRRTKITDFFKRN